MALEGMEVGVGLIERTQSATDGVTLAAAAAEADADARFEVEIFDDIEVLTEVWPSLADTSMDHAVLTAFQSIEFLRAWMATIGAVRGAKWAIIVVREAATSSRRPLLLLPLVIERSRGVRIARFADGGVSDYNFPVMFMAKPFWSSSEAVDIWDRIRARLEWVDVFELEKMPVSFLGRDNPLSFLASERWECDGHAANLCDSYDTFEKTRMSRPKRYRRYQRSLHREYAVSYRSVTLDDGLDERGRVLDLLFAQKARRFAETRVPGFEDGDGKKDFYRRLTLSPEAGRFVHLSEVRADEHTIACQWGLVHGSRYYYLICGNEAGEWQKYSTGRMINEGMLAWCHGEGLEVADFGIGDEDYKFDMCDEHIELRRHRSASTFKGRAWIVMQSALERARQTRAWQALRPYKWVLKRALKKGA